MSQTSIYLLEEAIQQHMNTFLDAQLETYQTEMLACDQILDSIKKGNPLSPESFDLFSVIILERIRDLTFQSISYLRPFREQDRYENIQKAETLLKLYTDRISLPIDKRLEKIQNFVEKAKKGEFQNSDGSPFIPNN